MAREQLVSCDNCSKTLAKISDRTTSERKPWGMVAVYDRTFDACSLACALRCVEREWTLKYGDR